MSPRLEHPCDLHDWNNIAIAMAYFSVGLAQSLINTPLNIYLVETLNAEPKMQNTINILCTLPWSFKLLFGFVSDAFPIAGMHRKPYLAMGMTIYSASFLSYSVLALNNTFTLAICLFVGTMGLIQLDVMCDTMCVERSKFEDKKSQGQMQASCYSIRFGGTLVGSFFGAALVNKAAWGWGLDFHQIAFCNGFIPFILIAPCLYSLREKYFALSQHLQHGADHEQGIASSSSSLTHLDSEPGSSSVNEDSALLSSAPATPRQKKLYKAMSFYDSAGIEVLVEEEVTKDNTAMIREQLKEIWGKSYHLRLILLSSILLFGATFSAENDPSCEPETLGPIY